MKVIKHGDTKATAREIVTKRVTCPICGCEFEYNSDEVIHGSVGAGIAVLANYVRCPECDAYCLDSDGVETPDGQEFSLSNPPRFPEDFYDFNYGVPQNNSDINDWIREATDYFLTHPDETLKFIACGDSILFALNMEDGIHFYVAKGYYTADID